MSQSGIFVAPEWVNEVSSLTDLSINRVH